MTLEVLGLDLRDVYGLLQRDTTGVHGELGLELDIGGTARAADVARHGARSARAASAISARRSSRAW